MSISEKVNAIKDSRQYSEKENNPDIIPPDLIREQDQNWTRMGERVGDALLELTGRNLFNLEEVIVNSSDEAWLPTRLPRSKYYGYAILQLRKFVGEDADHLITVLHDTLNGLAIYGGEQELRESTPGGVLRTATKDEIESAFARAVINPRFA